MHYKTIKIEKMKKSLSKFQKNKWTRMEKAIFKVGTGGESSSGTWVVLEHGMRNDVITEN